MSRTIRCTFLNVDERSESATRQYLQSIGMEIPRSSINTEKFSVELRELPEVLRRLEDAQYFLGQQSHSWNLIALTADGLTLYLCHPTAGDGCVHIPMANVLALYSVADSFIDDVQVFDATSATQGTGA